MRQFLLALPVLENENSETHKGQAATCSRSYNWKADRSIFDSRPPGSGVYVFHNS